MSYPSATKYTGAVPIAAYDPTPGVEATVDVRGSASTSVDMFDIWGLKG